MMLRILPPEPLPNVLFSISFSNLPSGLVVPQSWMNQLELLGAEDLEMPGPSAGMHALDKAACLVNLLQEVVFDVQLQVISCVFLDGTREEWPLAGQSCQEALQNVLLDVHEAGVERERERNMSIKPQPPIPTSDPVMSLPPPTIQALTRPKHKKQRSSIMSFVSSFLPLKSQSSRPSPTLPLVAPTIPLPQLTPPPTPIAPSRTGLTSLQLRRRARSNMVDLYSRFVLVELRDRFGRRGFPAWIAGSMLRRAQSQLDLLKRRYGLGVATPSSFQDVFRSVSSSLSSNGPSHSETSSIAPSLTDSASVAESEVIRTPPDSLSRSQSLVNTPAAEIDEPTIRVVPTAEEVACYAELSASAGRLQMVLRKMFTRERGRQLAERNGLRALEVRARRRAWSNKALGPERRALMKDDDLGYPQRPSPLGLEEPLLAEDLAQESFRSVETSLCLGAGLEALRIRSPPPRTLTIASGPHDLSDLFSSMEEGPDEYIEDTDTDPTSLLLETFPAAVEEHDLEPQYENAYATAEFPPSPTDFSRDAQVHANSWVPTSVRQSCPILAAPQPIHHQVTKQTSTRPRPRLRRCSEPVIATPLSDRLAALEAGEGADWLQELDSGIQRLEV